MIPSSIAAILREKKIVWEERKREGGSRRRVYQTKNHIVKDNIMRRRMEYIYIHNKRTSSSSSRSGTYLNESIHGMPKFLGRCNE